MDTAKEYREKPIKKAIIFEWFERLSAKDFMEIIKEIVKRKADDAHRLNLSAEKEYYRAADKHTEAGERAKELSDFRDLFTKDQANGTTN